MYYRSEYIAEYYTCFYSAFSLKSFAKPSFCLIVAYSSGDVVIFLLQVVLDIAESHSSLFLVIKISV